MPYALARKDPNASREWAWQWVFPSRTAGAKVNRVPRAATTMIYTPVLNRGPLGVRSPADILEPAEQLVLGPVNHG
jgi:hypothetical protein